MMAFAIQTIVFLFVVFIIGCFVGCWTRSLSARWSKSYGEEIGTPAAPQAAPEELQEPSEIAGGGNPHLDTAAGPDRDNLKRLSGIGLKIEEKLNRAGVMRFAQIAQWTAKDIAAFNEKLGYRGRIERENWVEQARSLAAESDVQASGRREK